MLATRITMIDGDGKVSLDTQADASTMENHNQRPEIVEARAHGNGSTRARSRLCARRLRCSPR